MEVNGKDVYFIAMKAILRKGDEIKYKIGELKTFFRVERTEHLEIPQKNEETGEKITEIPVRIFALGFEVFYLGGEIKLGKNHDKFEWFSIKDLVPKDYLANGWEVGLQDYLKEENKKSVRMVA